MSALRLAVLGGTALLLGLFALGASAEPSGRTIPGNTFAITDRTYYLSGDTGNTGGQTDVLLLSPEQASAQGNVLFLLPGLDVLGLIQQPSTETWFSLGPWDQDLEVVDDATAVLYFTANPQALAVFTVSLYDVAPDGQMDLVANDEQQFLTLLSSTPVNFELATTGLHLQQGHVLGLVVAAQTANAAVYLQYGGSTPSALESLPTRWLDSDGDKIPDSRESLVGRNPLNPDEPKVDPFVDEDGDGLADEVEVGVGTNPRNVDSDGDGWEDGIELHAGSNPLDEDSVPFDEDEDGLPDNFEYTYFYNTTYGPEDDPDGDDCSNLREALYGTSPADSDTDDDGVADCDEIADQTDPNNGNSVYLGPAGAPEPVATAAFFAIGSTLCIFPLLRRL